MTQERYNDFLRYEELKLYVLLNIVKVLSEITDEQCIETSYKSADGAKIVKEEFRNNPFQFSVCAVAEKIRTIAKHPEKTQEDYEAQVKDSLRKLKNSDLTV